MVDSLLRGHLHFHGRYVGNERRYLQALAEAQNPSAIYFGCSDSRVVPELLTNSRPGELFVVRNIANAVPPLDHADASAGAALEYAVNVLGVAHVIICGHYGCGGVKAVLDGRERLMAYPSLYEWLDAVEPAAHHPDVLAHAEGSDERWRAAVEQNVLGQLSNLISYRAVAEALEREVLQLHGWVYDLHSLRLRVYDAATDHFEAV